MATRKREQWPKGGGVWGLLGYKGDRGAIVGSRHRAWAVGVGERRPSAHARSRRLIGFGDEVWPWVPWLGSTMIKRRKGLGLK